MRPIQGIIYFAAIGLWQLVWENYFNRLKVRQRNKSTAKAQFQLPASCINVPLSFICVLIYILQMSALDIISEKALKIGWFVLKVKKSAPTLLHASAIRAV